MRELTISSLAFILALFSTIAVAAPKAAVSPAPKVSVYKDPSADASCKINGLCSSVRPDTCCGACILIDAENGYCEGVSCKKTGACNRSSHPRTCCGTCILIDAFNGYCLPPGSSIR